MTLKIYIEIIILLYYKNKNMPIKKETFKNNHSLHSSNRPKNCTKIRIILENYMELFSGNRMMLLT